MNGYTCWRPFVAAVALFLLAPTAVSAGSIKIEFSGHIDTCSECLGTGLENLLGTDFSGSVLFPDSEKSAVSTTIKSPSPFDFGRYTGTVLGIYKFAAGAARFTLHTAIPAFDLDGSTAPTIYVGACLDFSCPNKDNFVDIFVTTPTKFVALYLNGASPSKLVRLENVRIPDLSVLQSLGIASSFDVEPPNNTASVGTTQFVFPTPLHISISATSVPLPGSLSMMAFGRSTTWFQCSRCSRVEIV